MSRLSDDLDTAPLGPVASLLLHTQTYIILPPTTPTPPKQKRMSNDFISCVPSHSLTCHALTSFSQFGACAVARSTPTKRVVDVRVGDTQLHR